MKTKFLLLLLVVYMARSTPAQNLYQKNYTNSGDDRVWDITRTNDGNYLAGIISNGVIILSKINDTGNQIWTKAYNCNAFGHPPGYIQIKALTTGGFYVGIDFAVMEYGCGGIMRVKDNGDLMWIKIFRYNNGAPPITHFNSLDIDSSNNVYFSAMGDVYSSNYMLLGKFTPSGSLEFIKYENQPGSVSYMSSIAVHGNSIYCTGYFGSTCFLLKSDFNGNMIWQKTYSSSNQNFYFNDIKIWGSKIITTGQCNNNPLIFSAYDTSGIPLSSIIISCNRKLTGFFSTILNDSILLSGGTINTSSVNSFKNFSLFKIDTNLNLKWAMKYYYQNFGNGYLTGGTSTADHGYLLSGYYDQSGILIKTDNTGHSACFSDTITTITQTSSLNYMNAPLGFTPLGTFLVDTTVVNVYNFSFPNANICYTAINDETESPLRLEVFPNPVSEVLNLMINNRMGSNYCLRICNQTGSLVSERDISYKSPGINFIELNVSYLQPGEYFLTLSCEKSTRTIKFIKIL